MMAAHLWPHGEHVGPVDQRPVLDPRDAEDEAEQGAVVVEGPGHDAPRLLGDEEHRGGDLLREAAAPGEFLELDAGGAVGVGGEVADLHDGRGRGAETRPGRARTARALPASC